MVHKRCQNGLKTVLVPFWNHVIGNWNFKLLENIFRSKITKNPDFGALESIYRSCMHKINPIPTVLGSEIKYTKLATMDFGNDFSS